MRSLAIARKEFLEVVRNRKLMLAFLVQTIAVMALLPAFSDFLAQGNLNLPVPSLSAFVSLAVVDHTGEVAEVLEEDSRLRVGHFSALEEVGEGYAGVLVAENKGSQYNVTLYLREGIKNELLSRIVREDLASLESSLIEGRLERIELSTSLIEIEREYLKEVVVSRGGEEYSSFFLSYLVPLVLLFPLFFSGSLVMDSVVGEKERKTFEPLVTAPLPRVDVVRGKFLGIWLLLSMQGAIWMAIMMGLLSLPLANPLGALVMLSSLIALVVSLAMFQAMISKNIKEANISMMVLYILLFIFIIVALSVDFFLPSRVFEVLPVTLFARVISGGDFYFLFYPASLALSLALAGGFLFASERLAAREEVVFGGEVKLLSLASSLAGSYFGLFGGRRALGAVLLIVLLSPFALFLALSLEFASSFIVFFLLGFSGLALALMVLFSALVEEVCKLLAIYPLNSRGWLGKKSAPFAGLTAGIAFFGAETLLMEPLASSYFLGSFFSLLTLRAGTTMVMHALSGACGAVWVYSGRKRYLSMAVLLHIAFNTVLVGVAL